MPLKTFFCASVYGEGLPVGLHLQDEGVKVIATILDNLDDTLVDGEPPKNEDPDEKKRRLSMFDGMLKKVSNREFIAQVKKADPGTSFVFFDFNTLFKMADEVRELGIPGLYPTEEDRKLENDREAAKEFVKKHYKGIKVAEVHEFKTPEDGIKFLESAQEKFALKGFDSEAKTVVPDMDDPEEANTQIIDALTKDGEAYAKKGYILEKLIEGAKELTPEMIFYDGKPIFRSVDIELKKIGAGELGYMTGCAADLICPVEDDAEIMRMAFPNEVYKMAKKHKGLFIWDASLLFAKDGTPYFGEFCSNRPGYNAFYTELALMESAKSFFEALMDGKSPEPKFDFAASVRLFNFTPSGSGMKVPEGKSISWKDGDIWPMDVRKGEHGPETCGYDYQLAVATGVGSSPKEAIKDASMNAERVNFREKMMRPTDDLLSDHPASLLSRFDYGEDLL